MLPQLSVVLPCYNEKQNLPLILERYAKVAPKGLRWELVLVDNGSTDGSARALKVLLAQARFKRFARSVRVEVNQGYGFGMARGLREARGEVLAFSHADMQCDPRSVFEAYARLVREGLESKVIVKGQRQGRAWAQQLITHGMSLWASLILGRRLSDINAQPKVFRRHLLKQMPSMPPGFEFDVYVLERALSQGYQILTVPVIFGERAFGQSKWAHTLFSRWRTILRVFAYILRLRLRGGA